MYAEEKITLRSVSHSIVNGVEQSTVTSTADAWAKHRTATRAEFYAAERAGRTVTDAFTLFAFEYHGEQEIAVGDAVYDVVRSFQKNSDYVELSCERRIEA